MVIVKILSLLEIKLHRFLINYPMPLGNHVGNGDSVHERCQVGTVCHLFRDTWQIGGWRG